MPRLVPLELVVETHLPFQPRACALPPNLRRMGHVSQLCSSEVGNGDIRLLSVSLSHRCIPVMQSKASRTLPRAAWRAGRFPGGNSHYVVWQGWFLGRPVSGDNIASWTENIFGAFSSTLLLKERPWSVQ